ncbi:MAG TPA: hypothetical protein VKE96_02175 [Vicinamibacterales bacterium]|nr:hypothetical protein [Vicinamibacterales bacterium]
MRRQHLFHILCACACGAATLAVAATFAAAQGRGETYAADAAVKRPNGTTASAKLTATIETFATDADRDALIAAVGKGGTAARDLLASRKDAGSIQVGATKTPVKYAYARTTGSGRLITLVTAQPIHFVGGDLPDAKPKARYDLGLVLLDLAASKPGSGEVAPAAKVKVDAQKAIVTEDYGAEAVRLSNVVRQ